jgi:raffinose/stachyose/melibiose transport system substrate-binding protein
VWYNAEIFEEHRLTPPGTLDELLEVCAALKAKGVTPMALGNKDKWPGAFYFIYLAARSGGTELFLDAAARKPGRVFDDPAFVKAGDRLQRMVKAEVFSAGFNSLGVADARSDFMDGKAAMLVTGTWLVARAKKEKPDFLPKLKCFAFPTVADGKGEPTTVVGGVNSGFAVSSACKHREKAIELVRFLTSAEAAEAWCGTGRIPALRVSEEALKQLPGPAQAALELLQGAKSLQPYYDQYLSPPLAKEHKETTHGLFAGTVTPAEAARRMEKRAQGER